jgi:RNA polymerase-binding transcription factor DksA
VERDCVDSGQPIPAERLAKYRDADRCVACQTRADKVETFTPPDEPWRPGRPREQDAGLYDSD